MLTRLRRLFCRQRDSSGSKRRKETHLIPIAVESNVVLPENDSISDITLTSTNADVTQTRLERPVAVGVGVKNNQGTLPPVQRDTGDGEGDGGVEDLKLRLSTPSPMPPIPVRTRRRLECTKTISSANKITPVCLPHSVTEPDPPTPLSARKPPTSARSKKLNTSPAYLPGKKYVYYRSKLEAWLSGQLKSESPRPRGQLYQAGMLPSVYDAQVAYHLLSTELTTKQLFGLSVTSHMIRQAGMNPPQVSNAAYTARADVWHLFKSIPRSFLRELRDGLKLEPKGDAPESVKLAAVYVWATRLVFRAPPQALDSQFHQASSKRSSKNRYPEYQSAYVDPVDGLLQRWTCKSPWTRRKPAFSSTAGGEEGVSLLKNRVLNGEIPDREDEDAGFLRRVMHLQRLEMLSKLKDTEVSDGHDSDVLLFSRILNSKEVKFDMSAENDLATPNSSGNVSKKP
ncbi:unnamed protein product [Schistocephalus solidus]|uniref:Uncharacterized protein n=1 Tax=Schistocephalus solidus TaxID=70667 RepID=A0A183SBQ8_SCHSO|nr:unnamed protein product [Schistocephalus solidus]